jgi:hypothetical protein
MGNLRAGQGSTGAKGGLESSLKRMPNDLQGLGRPTHGNFAVPHWQLLKHKPPPIFSPQYYPGFGVVK